MALARGEFPEVPRKINDALLETTPSTLTSKASEPIPWQIQGPTRISGVNLSASAQPIGGVGLGE
jgi:hypothetical protein